MGAEPCHSPAVHRDGPILPELLLGLVHLPDEVDEALSCLWHALLRPVCELELADGPRLAVLRGEQGCYMGTVGEGAARGILHTHRRSLQGSPCYKPGPRAQHRQGTGWC